MRRSVVTFLLVVTVLAMSAAPALAATGRDFGEHVAEHALQGHFSGEMNPGTHRGFAGFQEHHEH